MRMIWMRGIAAAGLAWVALVGDARAQARPEAAESQDRPGGQARERGPAGNLPGPIDDLRDVQETGRMVFRMADMNNDHQISQKEAIDAGNLLVGGFFFRADANGDGTLTPEEARQARESLLSQKPFLRMVLERARGPERAEGGQDEGSNPIRNVASLLDGNQDRKLQATELRAAVQTAVQGLFEAADTDRDGQMTPSEVNAAAVNLARAAGKAAFDAADEDKNGTLSQEEFDKAILQPMHALFRAVDSNEDGQLSSDEAQAAQRVIMSRMQMLRDRDREATDAPDDRSSFDRNESDRPQARPRTPSRAYPAPESRPTAPAPTRP